MFQGWVCIVGEIAFGGLAELKNVEVAVGIEDFFKLLGQAGALFGAFFGGNLAEVEILLGAGVIMVLAGLQERGDGGAGVGTSKRIGSGCGGPANGKAGETK